MVLLPALLVLLAAAPPKPVAARTPPASATPAAQVLQGDGKVVGQVGSATFGLQAGTLLDAADVVQVPPGAWVALVLLQNGHAVRLDDDLSMAIKDLALFDAPAKGEPLEAQLNRLLTRAERTSPDRLIGFHAGQAGANTVGPQAAEEEQRQAPSAKAAPGPSKRMREERALPPPPPAAAQSLAASPELAESRARGGSAGPMGGGGVSRKAAMMDAEPVVPEADKEAKAEEPRGVPTASPLAFAADKTLQQCLAKAVQALGPKAAAAQWTAVLVKARLVGDGVQLRLPGALPPPPCAVQWFSAKQRKAQLDATWRSLEVTVR